MYEELEAEIRERNEGGEAEGKIICRRRKESDGRNEKRSEAEK